VLQGESLSDESAHRPPEYAWALHVEHLDYSRGIIAELVDTEWPSVVRGGTDPAIVNEDELVEDASASINEGSQSALVAAKPFRTTSGRPFPIRR
jgi:hypothetical protein